MKATLAGVFLTAAFALSAFLFMSFFSGFATKAEVSALKTEIAVIKERVLQNGKMLDRIDKKIR